MSQRSNVASLDALATVDDTTACSQIFDAVSRPVIDRGRRVRALRLGDRNDVALLDAISRGEVATPGFRNRDIRRLLHPAAETPSPREVRRLSARTSRRRLRAHGIIRKVPKTCRDRPTTRGELLTAALFATRTAHITQLLAKAA